VAAAIHTIDDDEWMRAGGRQTAALEPYSTGGTINLTVSSRRAEWASPGILPSFPAVTDAIFAATGKRLRELSIIQHSLWSLTHACEQFIQNGGHLHAYLSDALS
jgi:hypothetical protein